MKTTRTCKINSITKEQTEALITLIRTFESAKRYSFNRLIEGESEKELIKKLQLKYLLNKRFCEDAVLQVQTILSSQKELLPVYLENNQKKLEKTLQKKMIMKVAGKTQKSFIRNVSNWIKKKTTKIRTKN
ncbi:transposase IS605 [Bacillus anthracis str. 95014]|nr:transposase IS605 [Bacillus anthracis str. 95014]